MKVILIKIYCEEEEMVHVSMVSGAPLGLGDMTVISQITDRWRDGGPVGPRRSHDFHTSSIPTVCNEKERVSPRQRGLLRAIYTFLSRQGVNSPQDKPL